MAANTFDQVRVPFQKMTFSPDVPSTALGPNEYNEGINVETDVRGIRSVAGDYEILTPAPGTPTYISAGYRQNGEYWFIVATVEGYWWATNGDIDWYNITPGGGPIAGYTQATNITEAWNGTVPFFNDSLNAPMFWPDEPGAILAQYSNLVQPAAIQNIAYDTATTQKITIGATTTGSSISGTLLTIGTLVSGDIIEGQYVLGTGVTPGTRIVSNDSGSGSGSTWVVNTSQTVASTDITIAPYTTAPYVSGQKILISDVNNFYNGIYTVVSSTTYDIVYTAVPGAAYPGDSVGEVSAAYTWNYNPNWKSYYAGWMRIYNTPNVGSILVAGNLTATLLDDTVVNYPVTVQWSQAFGLNEAPLTWQPTITNVANQLEVPLRGACVDAFPCNGQLFLCSYWDTVVFSPINYTTTSAPILGVRLFNQGRGMFTSNAWANTDKLVYGLDSRDIWVFDGNDFQGLGNQRVKNWFFDQLDPDHVDRIFMEVNTQKNQVELYYTSKDADPANNGVPNKMISYRYDLDCWNPPRDVSSATFACESPIWSNVTDSSLPQWVSNTGTRTVVYARGKTDQQIVQKDYGYSWIDGSPIESQFRRDNLKLLPNYSSQLLLHRVLPELVNIGGVPSEISESASYYNLPLIPSPGNATITISGNNSTGSLPVESSAVVMPIATDDPWVQISQNAYRLNSIEISNTSNTDIWMCSAASFQYTQTQDSR